MIRRLALGALCLLGCARPPTEIVVRVDSDLREGDELRAVRIDATREGETAPSVHRVFDLTTGRVHLPGTLGMVPDDPEDSRALRVVVTGLLATGVTFDVEALVRFEPERTRQLDMFLARRCAEAENACKEGETCTFDGCALIARATLPELGVDAAARDVTAPRDVAEDLSRDAAPDVAPDIALDAAPDVLIDATIDALPDVAIDTPVDIARDIARDTPADIARDTPADIARDTGRDAPDAPTCGALGLPCCPGGVCGALQFCGGPGVCSACGREGMPCCPGNVCGTGLNCNTARGTVCEPCGHLGQLCCRLSVCSEFEFCSGFGVCGSCGDPGAPCCPVGPACRPGTACARGTCS